MSIGKEGDITNIFSPDFFDGVFHHRLTELQSLKIWVDDHIPDRRIKRSIRLP